MSEQRLHQQVLPLQLVLEQQLELPQSKQRLDRQGHLPLGLEYRLRHLRSKILVLSSRFKPNSKLAS